MDVDLAPFQGHGSGVDAMPASRSMRPGRRDGRAHNEMRSLSLSHDPLGQADGSARLKVGSTDVLVAIYGPLDGPVTKQDPESLHVHIAYRRRETSSASTSSSSANQEASISAAEEATTSRNIRLLINDTLLTQLFPRKAIIVAIQVLSDRGAVVATAYNATVAALLQAGVPMHRLPVASCVAVTSGALTVDPLLVEEREADAVVTAVFDTLLSDDEAFISVSTQGNCGGQKMFTAALHTCKQLAIKTRAFMSLSLQQKSARRFLWNTTDT